MPYSVNQSKSTLISTEKRSGEEGNIIIDFADLWMSHLEFGRPISELSKL